MGGGFKEPGDVALGAALELTSIRPASLSAETMGNCEVVEGLGSLGPECSGSSAGLENCLICLIIRRELCNMRAEVLQNSLKPKGWRLPQIGLIHISKPYQETFRQNPLAKTGLALDLAARLESSSVLMLNHTSTAPRHMTATHVGSDGYPQQPCHTTTLHTGSYQPWFG